MGAETTSQHTLPGFERKAQGMDSLKSRYALWIRHVRKLARRHCEEFGTVTSDNLHDIVESPAPHDNCWGVIFRDPQFRFTGRRVYSTRPEARGREIKVWCLR